STGRWPRAATSPSATKTPEWRLEPLKVYAVWPPNVPASSIAYTLINRLYEAFNPG
ncbi:hypothetical protein K3000_28595, partial [Pseudomonas aeruginosa]|nr:hypothetical protein [Pseudomonas aeruginosa]